MYDTIWFKNAHKELKDAEEEDILLYRLRIQLKAQMTGVGYTTGGMFLTPSQLERLIEILEERGGDGHFTNSR